MNLNLNRYIHSLVAYRTSNRSIGMWFYVKSFYMIHVAYGGNDYNNFYLIFLVTCSIRKSFYLNYAGLRFIYK